MPLNSSPPINTGLGPMHRRFTTAVVNHLVVCIMPFMLLLWGQISFVYAAGSQQKVTTEGLNEFDVAGFCYGAEYREAPEQGSFNGDSKEILLSRSQFGFTNLLGQKPDTWEFAYITARYYVRLGPNGDASDCVYRRYIYRLNNEGYFKAEKINESKFAQIKNSFYAYMQLNPNKKLGRPSKSSGDSVGNCVFPIEWHAIDGKDYALFSISRYGGIVDYITPHYEREPSGAPSACYAWGERHLTNSSITWHSFEFQSVAPDILFVESKKYQTGFLFKAGLDFQCVRGGDVFTHHILISRTYFDSEVRPRLESILRKDNIKFGFGEAADKPEIATFLDSVRLNQEIAAFVVGLTEKKGCN